MAHEPKLDVHPLTIDEARFFVEADNQELRNKIFDHLEDPTNLFRKSYAIMGNFGSGKTTLVNYIRHCFRCKSIKVYNLNANWTLPTINKSEEVRDWFFSEIKKGLLHACEAASMKLSMEEKEELVQITNNLRTGVIDGELVAKTFRDLSKYYTGFTILLDELHKPPQYQAVLDFLKGQQTLIHELCEMPIAIFVSCLDEWEKNFQLDAYSGIFDELVKLPPWTTRSAYVLIDKKLRDSAPDPQSFKNPFSHDAFAKVSLLQNVTTPRKWITQIKKVLENTPIGVGKITPSLVSEIISLVDDSKVEHIRKILHDQFPKAFLLIDNILKEPSSERNDLLSIIARLYRVPLPRPLADEDRRRIGIDGLPMLVETLRLLKVIKESSQSSPPIKIDKKVTEIQYKECYRLSQHIIDFFDKVDQEFGLDPEDYILKLASETSMATRTQPTKPDKTLDILTLIKEKLEINGAKAHISRAIDDYQLYLGAVFIESPSSDLPGLRAGVMAMYHLLAAFVLEETTDEKHNINFSNDLKLLDRTLKPGEKVAEMASHIYLEFQNVEFNGLTLTNDFSVFARNQIPEIMERISSQFLKWISVPAATRKTAEIIKALDKLTVQLSKPEDFLRSNAEYYIQTLAVQTGITKVGKKWVTAFFDLLSEKQVDKTLAEIIDIRCNPSFYGTNRFQIYKTALIKLGPAFEDTAMIIGRKHVDPAVQKTFLAPKLTLKYILHRLYPTFEDLKTALDCYSSFDRSQDGKDFEKKMNELLDETLKQLPLQVRAFSLTALIRNYYSHEGCQDTAANLNDEKFLEIINTGILSMLILVKDHVEACKITGFQISIASDDKPTVKE